MSAKPSGGSSEVGPKPAGGPSGVSPKPSDGLSAEPQDWSTLLGQVRTCPPLYIFVLGWCQGVRFDDCETECMPLYIADTQQCNCVLQPTADMLQIVCQLRPASHV